MRRFYKYFLITFLPFFCSCTWKESSQGFESIDSNEPKKIILYSGEKTFEEQRKLDKIERTADELSKTVYVDKDVNDFLEEYTHFLDEYINAKKKGDKNKLNQLTVNSKQLDEKSTKLNEKFKIEDKENNASNIKMISTDNDIYFEGMEKK